MLQTVYKLNLPSMVEPFREVAAAALPADQYEIKDNGEVATTPEHLTSLSLLAMGFARGWGMASGYHEPDNPANSHVIVTMRNGGYIDVGPARVSCSIRKGGVVASVRAPRHIVVLREGVTPRSQNAG